MSDIQLPADKWTEIREKAKKRFEAEMRGIEQAEMAGLAKRAEEEELARLRKEAGINDPNDDWVDFIVNCPPFTDRLSTNVGMEGERHFYHGHEYRERRGVFNDLRYRIAMGWDSERRAGNPNLRHYDQSYIGTTNPFGLVELQGDGSFVHRQTVLNGKTGTTVNAPRNLAQRGGLPAEGRAGA